jgi:hypothetical protein
VAWEDSDADALPDDLRITATSDAGGVVKYCLPWGVEPGAGSVPDGSDPPDPPLRAALLSHAFSTSVWIGLLRGESCLTQDEEYEIYEGVIGDFTSHRPRACVTGGATAFELISAPENSYYLVVPRNVAREGSYGTDGEAGERPPGAASCVPQEIEVCP